MRKYIFLSFVFSYSFIYTFSQNRLDDILKSQSQTFTGYSSVGKKADSISSKISFFGLSLLEELDKLVYDELNKTELLDKQKLIAIEFDSNTFQSVLRGLIIPDTIKRKYVLKDVASVTHVGMFILVRDLSITSKLSSLGAKISFSKANIITAYVPVDQIKNVLLIPEVQFVETAIPVKQNLDKARQVTNVNQVNSGLQLPQGYTGKNVLIGIIDGGFDYGHPAFYDSLGNYRVYSIWNQSDPNGINPKNFNYGSEESEAINITALETDDENDSHGTHVAGITSGANWSTTQKYKGIAYDSKLIFVSYIDQLNNLGIFDGINYIYQKASELEVPSVVNMSLGSHLGPHDGTSLFDRVCDALLNYGDNQLLTVVGAAGNEGNLPIHISKKFTISDTTIYSFINFKDKACGFPCYRVNGEGTLDFWGEKNKAFSVRVGIFNSKSNQIEYASPIISTSDNSNLYSYRINSGVEVFKIQSRSSEVINSKPHVTVEINSKHFINTDRQVFINIIGKNTEVHAWANHEYYVSFNDGGFGFSDVLKGNSDFSVGEIGGVGKSIISVGAYNSTADTVIGARASFSSYGPSIDGRLKPEITAPGNRIASSVNSYDQDYVSGFYKKDVVGSYDFLGRRYIYALMEGTSMSTPIIVGIIALWKEACPFISTNQIKTVLANTAIKDQFTGSVPNNLWGHGKIDAYVGIKHILSQMPAKPKLSISGDTTICLGSKVTVSAPSGFKKYLWNNGDTTRTITVDEEGEYIVIVQNDKGWWSYYSDTLNVYVDEVDAILTRFKPDNCLNSIYLKSNVESGQSISWYRNDTLIAGVNSRQFVPQISGIYKIKIQNDLTKCFDISDTLIIDMSKYTNRLFKSDSILTCSTDSIELDAGSGFKSYTWNTGAKTQKIKVGKTGMYSVTVNCGEDIVNFGYLDFPQNSPNSSRSYLRIPDANQLDFKDEMSLLINLNVGAIASSTPVILNKGSNASYQLEINWPFLVFKYPGIEKAGGLKVQIPQYTWFSIGVVKTKDSVSLYYNTKLVDRSLGKNPIPVNNQSLTIGKRAGVDYDYFVGGVDQLSFWNRALSQSEVAYYTNCTSGTSPGCVGFYNFDPSENDQSVYKNNATFYNSAVGGCCGGRYGLTPFTICSGSKSVSDSIYIKFEPIPTGKTSFSFDSRCVDQPIIFNNTSDTSKTFPLQWNWDMGDGTKYYSSSVKHSYGKIGSYNVKLSLTSTSCPKFKDSIIKQILIAAPTEPERYKHINARKDTETSVLARDFGVSYKWRPGNFVLDSSSKSTKAKISKETDFRIFITDNAGCTTIDSQLVRVFDKYSVFVPSAFSPDGNGINDRLKPILVGIKEVKSFRIYSRWGNLIYSTKDVSIGWDGTFNGSNLPVDTYTWVFEGIDEDGKPVMMSGKTTLIR